MITIQGKGVSAGVGVGPLYYYRRATAEIKRYTVEDTDAEWHRFKGAQTGAVEQLGQLAEQARAEAGDEAAMLFETHQMMAEDLDYEEAIEDRITNQKMNAEAAVSDTAEQFAEMFASMDDAYMQARAADAEGSVAAWGVELSAAYIDGMRDSDPNATLQESGLPVLLTYSGNERILSDTTQTETKAAVESLPDGQVVLDPFVNGDHNYTSEDPATNTQLDADLRQVTVDFLTSHLQ